MDHLVDFLTVMSWFWLVLSLISLGVIYRNYTVVGKLLTGRINHPLPWVITVTASFSWLLVSL